MENRMSEVAKLLGVEIGEQFDVVDIEENPCMITKRGMCSRDGWGEDVLLARLLYGEMEFKKLTIENVKKEYYGISNYGIKLENKMNEVAKILGVEIGEEFDVVDSGFNPHVLTEDGLYYRGGVKVHDTLSLLLYGNREIKKTSHCINDSKMEKCTQENIGIQPVQFVENDFSFEQMQDIYKFNIIKHISKHEKKDGLRDLYKAKDYLEMLIKLEEGEKRNEL